MTELLNQLPNGGAVVAIIVVVFIFIKWQEKYQDRMERIAGLFTKEISDSRKDYLTQLNRIIDKKSSAK